MNVIKENEMSMFGMETHKYVRNAAEYEQWLIEHSRRKDEKVESPKIDPAIVENVDAFNRLDDVAVKREIPPPQYNPDDVAFKQSDITESWYMVDGIDAQFETSSDAIAAAHDYVATHTMSTTVHVVASRKFAIIKPVITTELEYL